MSSIINQPEENEEDSFVILNEMKSDEIESALEASPSLASIQMANSIICEGNTHTEVVKLLEENKVLRETMKRNNSSLKEQHDNIKSMTKDMMAAMELQKTKNIELKSQVEKLENKNRELIKEMNELKVCPSLEVKTENICYITNTNESDDTIDKLSQQLALVEKERRVAMEENDTLKWQNESFKNLVLKHTEEMNNKNMEYNNLEKQSNENNQRKDMEIQDLTNKLRDAYQIAIQPVISNIVLEDVCNPENISKFISNLEEHNKNLKKTTSVLNHFLKDQMLLIGNSKSLVNVVEKYIPVEHVNSMKADLDNVKKILNEHDNKIGARIQSIKEALTCGGKIFNDYCVVLRNLDETYVEKSASEKNYEDTISKLENSLQKVQSKLNQIESEKNQINSNSQSKINELNVELNSIKNLAEIQLKTYKENFEDERKARSDLANEKVDLINQLRALQLRNQELMEKKDAPRTNKNGINRNSPELQDMEIINKPTTFCPLCDKEFKDSNLLQQHVYSCLDQTT